MPTGWGRDVSVIVPADAPGAKEGAAHRQGAARREEEEEGEGVCVRFKDISNTRTFYNAWD